jgi:spore coat protein U-like protein
MTRLLLTACLALLPLSAWPQRAKPPIQCPLRPADCQINVQVFDFGRGQMTQTSPSINGTNTISVTCTRANLDGLNVEVTYNLQAIPPAPARQMRDSNLHFLRYDMFVDPARTRYWGDGVTYGTFTFQGTLFLDDRNRVGTLAHVIYGAVDGGQLALPGQWLGLVVTRLEYSPICH